MVRDPRELACKRMQELSAKAHAESVKSLRGRFWTLARMEQQDGAYFSQRARDLLFKLLGTESEAA